MFLSPCCCCNCWLCRWVGQSSVLNYNDSFSVVYRTCTCPFHLPQHLCLTSLPPCPPFNTPEPPWGFWSSLIQPLSLSCDQAWQNRVRRGRWGIPLHCPIYHRPWYVVDKVMLLPFQCRPLQWDEAFPFKLISLWVSFSQRLCVRVLLARHIASSTTWNLNDDGHIHEKKCICI